MASVKERGQVLLVGGLALAVSLVVIALVLNSAIYTENLATRNSDTTDETGLELTRKVQTDGNDLLSTVNREPPFAYSGPDNLNTRYDDAFTDWSTVQRRSNALAGRSVDISSGSPELGTRIRDDGTGDADFVPASSGYNALPSPYDFDWAVVKDAKIRQFEMTVTNTGALPSGPAAAPLTTYSSAFFIEIRDGSTPQQWQIVPYEDSSGNFGIYVWDADAGSLVGTCTPGVTGGIDFDITAGTVEGEPCPALSFVETLDSTQDVYFVQAREGEGEYELVVDRVMESSAAGATGFPFESAVDEINYGSHCDGPTYEETASGEPFAVPALYATDVDTSYRTSGVTYENSVRIAPGESGDRTRHPRIEWFDVEDITGSTDAEFTVDWSVSDPDGGSPTVTVNMYSGTSPPFTSPVDSTSTPGDTLSDAGGDGGTYTLEIVVTDGSNSRTIREEHEDDEDGTGDGTCPE